MQKSPTTIACNVSKPSKPLLAMRNNSAQANLQSHPCFQSSLFNDRDRATGSYKAWRERLDADKNPNDYSSGGGGGGVDYSSQTAANKKLQNKDFQLEQIIWTQSVCTHVHLSRTLRNSNGTQHATCRI